MPLQRFSSPAIPWFKPVCLLVCHSVRVCVFVPELSVTEDSRDTKNLLRAQSATVQRSPLPPSIPLFPSHDVFLSSSLFLFPLMGSSCPFPSVSRLSTTQRPNNSRLFLPQAWTSSASWLQQATVRKHLMLLLLLGMGRNRLHGAGLPLSHCKQMLWVCLYCCCASVMKFINFIIIFYF